MTTQSELKVGNKIRTNYPNPNQAYYETTVLEIERPAVSQSNCLVKVEAIDGVERWLDLFWFEDFSNSIDLLAGLNENLQR